MAPAGPEDALVHENERARPAETGSCSSAAATAAAAIDPLEPENRIAGGDGGSGGGGEPGRRAGDEDEEDDGLDGAFAEEFREFGDGTGGGESEAPGCAVQPTKACLAEPPRQQAAPSTPVRSDVGGGHPDESVAGQGLPCSGGSGGSSARQRRRSSRTDGRPRGGTAAASKSGIGGGDTRGSAGGGGEGGTCAADVLTPGPKEVLIRILSFVSAEDLGCAAAACRALHTAAREDVLWRRLFCARWGKPTAAPDSGAGWRALYADADADECRAALAGAPEALRGAFADMQRAKRQACLGRAAVDDTAELPRCQAQRRLTEWRRQRGFHDGAAARPGNLSAPALRFHRLSPDLFVCEDTGWAHACGAGCREGIIDTDSGLITCPVSGRTTQRLVSAHEEQSLRQHSVDACFATAADAEFTSYSLALAYTDGYYADAREMKRRYGVHMR